MRNFIMAEWAGKDGGKCLLTYFGRKNGWGMCQIVRPDDSEYLVSWVSVCRFERWNGIVKLLYESIAVRP